MIIDAKNNSWTKHTDGAVENWEASKLWYTISDFKDTMAEIFQEWIFMKWSWYQQDDAKFNLFNLVGT